SLDRTAKSRASGAHLRPDLADRIVRVLDLIVPDEPLELQPPCRSPAPLFRAIEHLADHREGNDEGSSAEMGGVTRTPDRVAVEKKRDDVGVADNGRELGPPRQS